LLDSQDKLPVELAAERRERAARLTRGKRAAFVAAEGEAALPHVADTKH
jgi:hypothetical protein